LQREVMRISLEASADYLRVDVSQRGGPEEARMVVERILAEQASTGLKNVLIMMRESPAIFRVETWDFSGFVPRLVAIPGLRIALLSDSNDLYASQEYIALLSAQRGLNVAAFRNEQAALQWLLVPR
jgi:hypothetical protein